MLPMRTLPGMMLEMDNSELLILLDSEHQLKAKATLRPCPSVRRDGDSCQKRRRTRVTGVFVDSTGSPSFVLWPFFFH